ncbi:hypothetical protein D3C87_130000 [compost metagenome]
MKKLTLEKCFKLFTNCILVKGVSRACIYDLQRKNIYTVPLSIADIFNEDGFCNPAQFLALLDKESKEAFLDYKSFLINHELVFECEEYETTLFPNLNEEFLFPSKISNAVLDADSHLPYFTNNFLAQLAKLGCNYIQFRFFNIVEINELKRILEILKTSQVKSFEIILPEDKNDNTFYQNISLIILENPKISSLIISDTQLSEVYKEGANGMGYILKIKDKIDNHHHCGIIDISNFSVNITTYTESLKFNSCLNRKIAIDKYGDIKNCPSMSATYGNISSISLNEAINQPDFQKLWAINKDNISKCKSCEFRYVCTDCRAYIEDPNDILSAPLKCGYDPFTNLWEDWSKNPIKLEAISFYGFN